MSKLTRKEARRRRHRRIRRKISGTSEIPRLSVCRTGRHLYAQFIDDVSATTLASASSLDSEFRESGLKVDLEGAELIGKMAGKRALAADIKRVVFDRGGTSYHGRVAALAQAAREAGLEF